MKSGKMRVAFRLSPEVLEELDRVAGPRGRSAFVAEVLTQELARLRRLAAFDAMAGSLAGSHIPEWDTPESTYKWIREGRRDRRDPWGTQNDEGRNSTSDE